MNYTIKIILICLISFSTTIIYPEVVKNKKICELYKQAQEDPHFDYTILDDALGDNHEFQCGDQIITFTRTINSAGNEIVEWSYRDVREDIDSFEGTADEKQKEINRRLEEDIDIAIKHKDLKGVKAALDAGMPVNGFNNDRFPLRRSVFFDAPEIIKYLLSHSATLPSSTIGQSNLLFEAISDSVAIVLIKAGISPGLKNYDGTSFFLHSVEKNLIESIKIATKHFKIDINERDKYGKSLLTLACIPYVYETAPISERHAMVTFLLELGADANDAHDDPNILSPIIACHQNRVGTKTLELLIENGADPDTTNFFGWTIFSYMGEGKYRKQMKELKKKYNGKNTMFPSDNSPVFDAVVNNNYEIVSSASAKDLETLQGRTDYGLPTTPLHQAVIYGDKKTMNILFRKKLNWNVPDAYGATPLYWVVLNDDVDMAAKLIKHGADPDITQSRNYNGYSSLMYTPLDYAVAHSAEMTSTLLKAGAKPHYNAYNKEHVTISHAVESGNLESVKVLIAKGAGIKDILTNPPSDKDSGKNKLFLVDLAAENGYVEIVQYLINKKVPLRKKKYDYIAEAKKIQNQNNEYLKNMADYTGNIYNKSSTPPKKGHFKITCNSDGLDFPGSYASYPVDVFPAVDKQPVDVYVPENYSSDTPSGLIIFMGKGKPGKSYVKVLDKKNMIWAGFNPYSADKNDVDSGYLAIAAAYHLQEKYNIDPDRIYISGFSWGGLISSNLINRYPFLFKGMISMGRGINAGGLLINERPVVYSAGDFDFNIEEAYITSLAMIRNGYKHVAFIQDQGKGHQLLSGDNFQKALEFLEEHRAE